MFLYILMVECRKYNNKSNKPFMDLLLYINNSNKENETSFSL